MKKFLITLLLVTSSLVQANYVERNHYLVDFLKAIKTIASDGVTINSFEYTENFSLNVPFRLGRNKECEAPISINEAVNLFKEKVYTPILFNSRHDLTLDQNDEALGLSGLQQFFTLNDRDYENKYFVCQFEGQSDFGRVEDYYFISYDNRTRILFRINL